MQQRARQSRMTPAERMKALRSGQPIDRVPFWPFMMGFPLRNVGYPIAAYYNDPEKCFWAQVWTQEQYGYDGFPLWRRGLLAALDFGVKVTYPSGEYDQGPTPAWEPGQEGFKSEEDLWKLELPDVRTAPTVSFGMEFSKLQDKYGLPITVSCGSPALQVLSTLGVNRFCRWLIRKPELIHRLSRLATDFLVNMTQYWVDTFGAERIIAVDGDGLSNDIVSPKQFAECGFPYLNEVHERILAMGVKVIFTHYCADQNLNLPYLAQIPLGDLGMAHFGHQVDLTTGIKYFGDRNIVLGNIEPELVQNLTPQQLYEHCRQTIEKGKHAPRGYILMTGCEHPPMTPPYNVYIMQKAVEDFGWYE